MNYNFDYEIYKLSAKFYNNYPHNQYPEILEKPTRRYNCILVDINTDYFICLPFRSDMRHQNGYSFKKSKRSKHHRSGIDYSKMVIIKDVNYLEKGAIIDTDEYKEMVLNINTIVNDSVEYLLKYINHKKGISVLHEKQYQRLYGLSSLPYFDSIIIEPDTNHSYKLNDKSSSTNNDNVSPYVLAASVEQNQSTSSKFI